MRYVCLLIGLLVACGPDEAGQSFYPAAGGKADTVNVIAAGRHALDLLSITRFRDRDTGEEWNLSTRVTALATVAVSDEETTTLALQPCRVTLPEISGHQPWLPAETVALAAPVTVVVEQVTADDGAAQLRTGPAVFNLGRDEAGTVLDQDGDGLPGITVRVSFFSVYVALRLEATLQGGATGGTANITLEQAVLGDNIPFYDAAAQATEAQARSEVLWTDHRFTLAPTVAGSCHEMSPD